MTANRESTATTNRPGTFTSKSGAAAGEASGRARRGKARAGRAQLPLDLKQTRREALEVIYAVAQEGGKGTGVRVRAAIALLEHLPAEEPRVDGEATWDAKARAILDQAMLDGSRRDRVQAAMGILRCGAGR